MQSTEAAVGPYLLQDFSLFHVLRYGFRPVEDRLPGVARLARRRAGEWPPGFPKDERVPTRWRRSGTGSGVRQRFFGFAQFKRSAMPNGPKVAAGGSLSPRGDWRAPSDMSARIWLDEVRREVPES